MQAWHDGEETHCRDSISIQSKGLAVFQCFSCPRATSSRSATKLM